MQGFGAGCDGLGGPLNPYNGLRNLVMEKRIRLEESCQFPDWLAGPQKWQIIPQVTYNVVLLLTRGHTPTFTEWL